MLFPSSHRVKPRLRNFSLFSSFELSSLGTYVSNWIKQQGQQSRMYRYHYVSCAFPYSLGWITWKRSFSSTRNSRESKNKIQKRPNDPYSWLLEEDKEGKYRKKMSRFLRQETKHQIFTKNGDILQQSDIEVKRQVRICYFLIPNNEYIGIECHIELCIYKKEVLSSMLRSIIYYFSFSCLFYFIFLYTSIYLSIF